MRVRILSFFTFHRAADRGPSVAAVVTIAVSVGAGGVGSWSSSSGFSLWYIVRAQVVVRVCREPRQQQAGTVPPAVTEEVESTMMTAVTLSGRRRVACSRHFTIPVAKKTRTTHRPPPRTSPSRECCFSRGSIFNFSQQYYIEGSAKQGCLAILPNNLEGGACSSVQK